MIEQAIETAALMLGTDKSRGYCLEMIDADFLAGAHLDDGNPEILLHSISRYYKFLPGEPAAGFLRKPVSEGVLRMIRPKAAPLRLDPLSYEILRQQILCRDGWRCQVARCPILRCSTDLEVKDVREALRYAAEAVRERGLPVVGGS